MKNQYLTYDSIKSHAVQFKALKDSKEVRGLPKLTEMTDVLSWVDTADKYLQKILGQDHSPLAYLTRDNVIIPATTDNLLQAALRCDDSHLFWGKPCFSLF